MERHELHLAAHRLMIEHSLDHSGPDWHDPPNANLWALLGTGERELCLFNKSGDEKYLQDYVAIQCLWEASEILLSDIVVLWDCCMALEASSRRTVATVPLARHILGTEVRWWL